MSRSRTLPAIFILGISVNVAHSDPSGCGTHYGLEFIRLPAGTFTMGANSVAGQIAGYKDERPPHPQSVSSFCIMKDHLSPSEANTLRSKFKIKASEFEGAPPELLTWRSAVTIAKGISEELKKNIRLPTELEWEYAARGGLDGKQFPWGDLDDQYNGLLVRNIVLQGRLNCKYEAVKKMLTDPQLKRCVPNQPYDYEILGDTGCVSKILNSRIPKPVANNYGLLNMVNNDWEWTSSRYMPYPYKPNDGREDMKMLKRDFRVVRGGSRAQEACLGYTSLRGYGLSDKEYESTYQVRFVLQE